MALSAGVTAVREHLRGGVREKNADIWRSRADRR